MKRPVLLLFLLAICFSASAGISGYFAQVAVQAGVYTSFMAEEGWEFDGAACFYGAMLEEGESVSNSAYFNQGVNYNVWCFGDEDVNDLDLKITDSKGNLVCEDVSEDKIPNCLFNPRISDSYTITVTSYDANDMALVFWGIMSDAESMYFNSGGKCANALVSAIEFFEYLDEYADAGDYRFLLNKISLIGGIMNEGETQCFYNFTVPYDSSCFFVGFGSEEVLDFDIKVCEQRGLDLVNYNYEDNEYQLVGADNTEDAVASVYGMLWNTEFYALKYRNYSSTESGFVFTLILAE
ncbi:MAG: hypothetical protein PHD87_00030 [Candidatus Cloacimonetes bacterium]|nr:hypothetical protein [Candidatus Cloacimonadota bacterium]